MKPLLHLMMIFFITGNALAQDYCAQLRSGLRELDDEHAQLCSEYQGTCAFLKSAEQQLRECKGNECFADLALAIGGCGLMIGFETCSYVGNRLAAFKKRRERIENLASENNCLLF